MAREVYRNSAFADCGTRTVSFPKENLRCYSFVSLYSNHTFLCGFRSGRCRNTCNEPDWLIQAASRLARRDGRGPGGGAVRVGDVREDIGAKHHIPTDIRRSRPKLDHVKPPNEQAF